MKEVRKNREFFAAAQRVINPGGVVPVKIPLDLSSENQSDGVDLDPSVPNVSVDVSTEQDVANLQEIIDRLLENCGPVDDQMPDFFCEGGTGFKGYSDCIHALVKKAQESARCFKVNTVKFFKKLELIRRVNFIFSKLSDIDFHALVAQIRLFFSRLACIRVPLFEFGPETRRLSSPFSLVVQWLEPVYPMGRFALWVLR